MQKLSLTISLIFLSHNGFGQKKWIPLLKNNDSQGYYKLKAEETNVKTRGRSFLPSSYSLRKYATTVGKQGGDNL